MPVTERISNTSPNNTQPGSCSLQTNKAYRIAGQHPGARRVGGPIVPRRRDSGMAHQNDMALAAGDQYFLRRQICGDDVFCT